MRLPLLALVLLAAVPADRAAAQRTPPDTATAGDTVPAPARIVDMKDLTDKPELTNRAVISRLLTRIYPTELRDEGITGHVTVTLVIDPAGVPRVVSVTGGSGVPAFDDAALRVTRAMRFTPPVLDGAPVWVRMLIPLEFSRAP